MTVRLLSPRRAAELRARPWTYPEVGQSRGDLPVGYKTFRRTAVLPAGTSFDTAASDLLAWRVQRSAGLRVTASEARVEPGTVVELGIGPIVLAPCRVVYVIDEPARRGFAYGTLPGHAECGEEAFVLDRREDGAITFTVTAFSRPASLLAKLAGPLGGLVQNAMTARYLRTFDR